MLLTAALLSVGYRPRRFSRTTNLRTSRGERNTQPNLYVVGEESRGRSAKAPSEIPPRGWKDILWRVYENISEHRVVALAAGITFYSLLAIFPAIAALVSIYGLFADPATISTHLDALTSFLPGGAIEVVGSQIARLTAQSSGTLGITLIVGLAVSLWSANAGIKSLFDALNVVYSEREKRSFVRLNAISLTFTTATILFLLIALCGIVVLPIIFNYVGLPHASEVLMQIARWPVLVLFVGLGLAFVYRYGPSREKAKWRWVTGGSALAAVAWLVMSALFSWYAANFGKFNQTYGSLGAIIGFMTWIWLSGIVILVGAELDAEMEHQTAQDTTTGRPRPLAKRGATMADTVSSKGG